MVQTVHSMNTKIRFNEHQNTKNTYPTVTLSFHRFKSNSSTVSKVDGSRSSSVPFLRTGVGQGLPESFQNHFEIIIIIIKLNYV